MKLVFKNATWLIEQIDKAIEREDKRWEEYIDQWKQSLLSKKRYTWYLKPYYPTPEQAGKEIATSLSDIWNTDYMVYCRKCWRVDKLLLLKSACTKAKERDALIYLDDEEYALIFGNKL